MVNHAQVNGGSNVEADADTTALELTVQKLRTQNKNLSKALVHSKEQQNITSGELNKIRLELEALNMFPLGTDDQRLVEAVANRNILEERIANLETASISLSTQVREYVNHAIVTDDEQRTALESKLRDLDKTLGLRDKPLPQIDLGSLQQAKIVGIDSQSGTLIFNAGEKQEVRIGMTFRILRGKSQIAEAQIAEVRPNISGALIVRFEDNKTAVRPGDIASIKIQN